MIYALQVFANDLDSEENGNVSYYIERGDRHKQFQIDQKTGQITVAASLDRENVSRNLSIVLFSVSREACNTIVPRISDFQLYTGSSCP